MHTNPAFGDRILGRAEMHNLAMAAIAALEECDLHDQLGELHSRVLSRSPEAIVDAELVAPEVWRWTFKPMVELVLHEVRDVARATQAPIEDRRAQIQWVLHVAGL